MKIIQMLVGQMSVFAYIVGCEQTGEAVVIDPAGNEDDIVAKAGQEGLKIKKILNTHGHGDHACGNKRLKDLTGAELLVHEADHGLLTSNHSAQFISSLGCEPTPAADAGFKHGDKITVGSEVSLEVIHTPGHTQGSCCFLAQGNLFTGDTLFVGAVGRTDLPGGSWEKLKRSIHDRILTLPDDTIIWPGHNYGPSPKSTVALERSGNPYLR